MATKSLALRALEEHGGILWLAPNWVPRSFCRPGRRLRLHPDDYFALGLERGGIDERWFSCTTPADNGPGTPANEGLSYIVADDAGKERLLLTEAVDLLKGDLIGDELYRKYGKWPMFSKFFDNMGPLPHHIHHRDQHAKLVGEAGKPEMYFFPAQYNNYGAELPFTFFGIQPHISKETVKEALMAFEKGDNKLTNLSQAYRITLDTGWDVPPGVLHAPASLCTYEPQFASDVYAMYQSVLYYDHAVPVSLLWKNCPPDKIGDYDYLMDVIDWDVNVDPYFAKNRMMAPKPAGEPAEMRAAGYYDEWICYKCRQVCAKRLTVEPGRSIRLNDAAAYGLIAVQGNGTINGRELSSPNMIRFGQLTRDEYFVSNAAAREGVEFRNTSSVEPLVVLRHFAGNPDLVI